MLSFRTVGLVILGLLIAGFLLFFGDRIFQEQFTLRPAENFLNQEEAIASFQWETIAGEDQLHLQLHPQARLEDAVARVELGLLQHMRHLPKIVVSDERTPELETALRLLRFDLEEALVQGNFGRLPEVGERLQMEMRLDQVEIAIDAQHLYVTIKHRGRFLFEVFDRHTDEPEGRAMTSKNFLSV